MAISFLTTESQREILTSALVSEEANAAFNESVVLRFEDMLDLRCLRFALQQLFLRHEALRTSFSEDGLHGYVSPVLQPVLCVTDFSHHANQDDAEEALQDCFLRLISEGFDLFEAPLSRLHYFILPNRRSCLALVLHHLVADGWSLGVLVRDLAELYSAALQGRLDNLPQTQSLAAFAEAEAKYENSVDAEKTLAFWQSHFANGVPLTDLGSDFTRPANKTYASRRLDIPFETDLFVSVKQMSKSLGASLFQLLYSAYALTIAAYCGEEDAVIGTPFAGQTATDTPEMVGHCVYLLPFRFQVPMGESFESWFPKAKTQLLDGIDHCRFTFGKLIQKIEIQRQPGRIPLVNLTFNADLSTNYSEFTFGDLAPRASSIGRSFENFEIFVNISNITGQPIIEIQYNTDLFSEQQMRARFNGYLFILKQLVNNHRLGRSIPMGQLSFLHRSEILKIALGPALESASAPGNLTYADFWRNSVQFASDKVALYALGKSYSYAQIDQKARILAAYLLQKGVGLDDLIGVYLSRDWHLVAAILAVQLAGGCHLPLDSEIPGERVANMCEDAQPVALLVDKSTRDRLPANVNSTIIDVSSISDFIDFDDNKDLNELEALPHFRQKKAYVLFTSGSTGRPKGSDVTQENLVFFLRQQQQLFAFRNNDVFMAQGSISFDITVWEILFPLASGRTVVLATRDDARDPELQKMLIERYKINNFFITPSSWKMLLLAGWEGVPDARLASGGEAMSKELAHDLLGRGQEVWNLYGPTETTVVACGKQLSASDQKVTIGRALPGARAYVLSKTGAFLPPGVIGELAIAGPSVCAGYRNRPELSAERFVPDPLFPGERMYLTGDLVKIDASDNIEYWGRKDFQVKIQGHRIELGEVLAQIEAIPGVQEAFVDVLEQAGGKQLLAWYVGEKLAEAEIKAALGRVLPDYMIPAYLHWVAQFPLNSSRKIDRAALLQQHAPVAEISTDAEVDVSKLDPVLLSEIKETWSELLSLDVLPLGESVFRLGAHSILVVQFTSQISKKLGQKIPVKAIFQNPSIAKMTQAIAEFLGQGNKSEASISKRKSDTALPLTRMQRRAWWMHQTGAGGVLAPTAYRIQGELNVSALRIAIGKFIARHEAFRLWFDESESGVVQHLAPSSPSWEMPELDMSSLAHGEREAQLMAQLKAWVEAGIDVAKPPLLRLGFVKLSEQEHVLFLMSSALIFDGWCFDITINELSKLYTAECSGQHVQLDTLNVHYPDYAVWSSSQYASDKITQEVKFWSKYLQGARTILDMPTDKLRPRIAGAEAQGVGFSFEGETLKRMRAVAQDSETTLFSVFMTCFSYCIGKIAGVTDLLIGVPVRDRNSEELEKMIGRFVSTSVFRAKLQEKSSFKENLKTIGASIRDTLSHESIPFEEVLQALEIKQDRSRPALYQSSFSYQDVRNRSQKIGSCLVKQIVVDHPAVQGDIGVWVKETDFLVEGEIVYAESLFEEASICEVRNVFCEFLNLCAEEPNKPLELLFDDALNRKVQPRSASLFWVKSLESVVLNVLAEHEELKETALLHVFRPHRESHLYFTSESESAPSSSELRKYLRERLTDRFQRDFGANMSPEAVSALVRQCIPKVIEIREELRRSVSGAWEIEGLDRAHLIQKREQPLGATEKQIAAIWAKLIPNVEPSRTDNFFDLGGTSLQSLEMLVSMQAVFGVSVPATEIILSSLSAIAAWVDAKRGNSK